jgi:long-chain acyl-CoA synthetase
MTEDCVYAHFNTHGNYRHGTVGKPLKNLKTKITPDGEIRILCPGMTKGYYKEPELTAALFDDEGYLKTGDRGEYSSDGYLTIIGRVKDQFKTDKGKYVDPAPIEAKVLENSYIEQACVVGMGVPQPIVLSVLSELGQTKSKDEIIRSIADTLEKINPHLESYERLATAVIMREVWTIENGLMTPSMKIKRNEVEKIHLKNYPKWYEQDGVVVWE